MANTLGNDGTGGHCMACKYWQADPQVAPDPAALGLCLQDELAHVQLQLTGDSGCNRFEPAAGRVPARAQQGGGI